MHPFQPHQILVFSPVSLVIQPQSAVHRLAYGFSLTAIRRSILADEFGDTGSQQIAAVVVCRRMGHRPAVIIECVTRPDTAVGIVEMVAVGVVVAFLPCKMCLDDRPHLPHIGRVGIIAEMPEKLVHIVEVHVIMVHLIVALGIAADVTIAVHLCTPLLLSPSEIHLRVVVGMRQHRLHIRHLTLGIGIEMSARPILPS